MLSNFRLSKYFQKLLNALRTYLWFRNESIFHLCPVNRHDVKIKSNQAAILKHKRGFSKLVAWCVKSPSGMIDPFSTSKNPGTRPPDNAARVCCAVTSCEELNFGYLFSRRWRVSPLCQACVEFREHRVS